MKFSKGQEAILLLGCMLLQAAVPQTALAAETAAETQEEEKSFRIWSNTMKMYQSYTEQSQSPFHTGLNERTGIRWEWEWPAAGTDTATAYNLMLSSEELPDVIYYRTNHRVADQYLNDGIIIPLNDYIEEYAPNMQKYFEEHEEVRKSCTTDSGSIYMFPWVQEELWMTTLGPVIRKDWLDEQGLEVPETYEDWENVLTVFKEKYHAAFGAFDDHIWFGLLGGTREYIIDDNGKVQYGYTLDETRKSLEMLADWNRKGLLDPDFSTLDTKMVDQKVRNGEIGLCYAQASAIDTWKKDGIEMLAIPYPTEKKGERVQFSRMNTNVNYGYGAMVTTACEDVEAVVKALDWGFSEEGMLFWNCGTEGIDYEIEDGRIVFTDHVLNNPQYQIGEVLQQDASPFAVIGVQTAASVIAKQSEEAVEAMQMWADTDMPKHQMPMITQTQAETEAITGKLNAISSYSEEMWYAFISGETPLTDETWADYKDQLDSMGLADVVAAKQAAYDRYLNR